MTEAPANPPQLSPAANPEPVDESIPFPPRYWWRKRIAAASIAFVLLLVAVRLAWGWHARHRLQAEIDRLTAAGEPIHLSDFDLPAIPDEENRARLLLRAAEEVSLTNEDENAITHIFYHNQDIPSSLPSLRRIVESNQSYFRLIEEAAGRPSGQWRTSTESYINGGRAWLSPRVERPLQAAVVCHAYDGNSIQCLNDLERWLSILEVGCDDACIYPGMLSDSRLLRAIELILQNIQLTGRELPRPGSTCVFSPDEFRQLIALLREDRDPLSGVREAIRYRRAEFLYLSAGVLAGRHSLSRFDPHAMATSPDAKENALRLLLAPAWRLAACRIIQHHNEALTLVDLPWNWKRAAEFDKRGHEVESPSSLEAAVQPWSTSSLGARIGSARHQLARRRVLATAIALRWFELEHGKLAEDLDALVPNYLPAVLVDPFAPGGSGLGYVREGVARVYSIGHDGRNDGDVGTRYGNAELIAYVHTHKPAGE